MEKLKIVAAQINFLVGDILGNAKRIIETTQHCEAQMQADLVVFPELALTGYPPEDLLFRPGFYTRCNQALQEIEAALSTCKTAVIIGYPEKVNTHAYNKAALIKNGKLTTSYAKQKLPNYEVFDEKRYFIPGNSSCLFNLKGIDIAIAICEDLWTPDVIEQATSAGAQLIVSPNASPFDRQKARAREKMLIQRAHECHVPIIYVNLVGGQDEIVFDGGSMVVNANGERVQQAAYYAEELMLVEVEPGTPVHIIPKSLPPRLSADENLYKALVMGVRDYVHKNNFPGALIGLSGGIDSALTLAIAVDALGAENVRTIMMPSRYTASMSIEDAFKQAETMSVKHDVIEIEPIFNAFLSSLAFLFENTKPDSTEENIQARIRGMLLMALSNKFGYIVLTTGNKSEMSVGYATLYGDMAGGFAVLKDIPKTMVYKLANYRNQISPVIPERVIDRPPSAELAENQEDQDTLPPYEILDKILELYIEKDEDPIHIYATGIDKETINRVIRMVNHNEYKRRQAPIGIRTTQRAFGKDRRYPITSGYSKNI